MTDYEQLAKSLEQPVWYWWEHHRKTVVREATGSPWAEVAAAWEHKGCDPDTMAAKLAALRNKHKYAPAIETTAEQVENGKISLETALMALERANLPPYCPFPEPLKEATPRRYIYHLRQRIREGDDWEAGCELSQSDQREILDWLGVEAHRALDRLKCKVDAWNRILATVEEKTQDGSPD